LYKFVQNPEDYYLNKTVKIKGAIKEYKAGYSNRNRPIKINKSILAKALKLKGKLIKR